MIGGPSADHPRPPARKDRTLHQSKYRPLLASCVLAFAAFGPIGAASAEGRLEARYSATLAGISIGSGSWTIEAAETQYTATVNGSTSGLLRAFTGGQGNATARSTLNGGKVVSSIYAATITTRNYTDSIRITISNGNVKDFRIDPPQDANPERVPITEAHQHNVLDPMTASLVRVFGNGDVLSPEACDRTLAVFDGRLRYDVQFAFKRMDNVRQKKAMPAPWLYVPPISRPLRASSHQGRRSSTSPSSARWRSGWHRSPARAFWRHTALRARRRSARRCSRRPNSSRCRFLPGPRPTV